MNYRHFYYVYLKTPPKATSSPKIHAVGSFSKARSIALVIACSNVIFVVSPIKREIYIYFYVWVLSLKLPRCIPSRNVLPLVVSVGSGVYVKCACLLAKVLINGDEKAGCRLRSLFIKCSWYIFWLLISSLSCEKPVYLISISCQLLIETLSNAICQIYNSLMNLSMRLFKLFGYRVSFSMLIMFVVLYNVCIYT